MRLAFSGGRPRKIIGNSYGWYQVRIRFYEGLEKLGVVWDENADTVFHCSVPFSIKCDPKRRNILYTMWENEDLEPEFAARCKPAELIIVPSQFCKGIFEKHTGCKTVIVPLGVDTSVFHYVERRMRLPFRWLWVGAAGNARKGSDVLAEMWNHAFAGRPEVHLYCKATRPDMTGIQNYGNVTFDMRDLPEKELAKIYFQSHGFLFPTATEGFGLTAIEALATGLPTIATNYSGHLEFMDSSIAHLVGYEWREADTERGGDNFKTAWCSGPEMANRMVDIMADYPKALQMGKRAAKKMQQFTWKKSIERLYGTLKDALV